MTALVGVEELRRRALDVMPGGVNSPVRAFGAVGGEAPYIVSGSGSRLRTADGRELIDLVAAWGAQILGHAHPVVVDAVTSAAANGMSFGMTTPDEIDLAELVRHLMPSIEVLRLVNSGTEATMSALRLARAATGRSAVVKFEGCYHGHGDPFLVKAGSGLATFGVPSSPGVPDRVAADTLVACYNDLESVGPLLHSEEVAAVIVEPVAGNMGCVLPEPGFLPGLRKLCDDSGTLLVFDEVMTGFRVALGGAQSIFGVTPDLTTLGKVVAGGTPGAAYGGRRDLMRMVAPEGPVYQAGTMSGNPLVTAAGLATLKYLSDNTDLYRRLDVAGDVMSQRLGDVAAAAGTPIVVNHRGGMVGVFLGLAKAGSWDDVATLDTDLFNRFFHEALNRGVLLPPSPFETWFLMESHLDGDFETAVDVLGDALAVTLG
jgi:glutamate-1-semialdehyde 2,1-aminomutase